MQLDLFLSSRRRGQAEGFRRAAIARRLANAASMRRARRFDYARYWLGAARDARLQGVRRLGDL